MCHQMAPDGIEVSGDGFFAYLPMFMGLVTSVTTVTRYFYKVPVNRVLGAGIRDAYRAIPASQGVTEIDVLSGAIWCQPFGQEI